MTELEKKFEEMLVAVRDKTIDLEPNNSQKLKLYAFYQQVLKATIILKNSALRIVERTKCMVCNAIKWYVERRCYARLLKWR
ncbi:hypothetical protein ACH24_00720 [Francisella persica ATCC VR-331]|uniref:Uncharacterized protein n=1 Tax=Francisella persica ATCC VR-331 TaxID=1086726 RepID=A0AAC8VDP3_9GAMM|nr:hypothetical protein ACH24_00720 [Francisella persica ATCC VR-331]ANH77633.1 hypothetical protein FSC845_03545 [Francisella persica ATCC VR-331]